jgi:serine protease Do
MPCLSPQPFASILGGMNNRLFLSVILICAAFDVARGDVLQLRDKAAVSGTILAEKRDAVVVDLGYTVLTIPRSQIVRIGRDEELAAQPASPKTRDSSKNKKSDSPAVRKAEGAKPEANQAFYSVSSTPPPERSVRELVNQLGESVVQVRTPGGLGSGFFINEDGYLITNFHVIEGESQISLEVYLRRNNQLERTIYKQVRIVAMNKFQDLALLKVEDKDAPKFSSVALGDADALAVGERVFAIGSPLGLERTVTEGIVSTKTRQMQGELYLQTTAQINPGNSGGPLFNMRGEAVGVTNMKVAFGEGIGFAIPIDTVKRFLNHREAYAYDNDNPSSAYRYLAPPSRLRKLDAGIDKEK